MPTVAAEQAGVGPAGEGVVARATEHVTTAEDGVVALEHIGQFGPDVALVDIAMPRLTGIEVTREATETHPSVAILILTVHDEEGLLHFGQQLQNIEFAMGQGINQGLGRGGWVARPLGRRARVVGCFRYNDLFIIPESGQDLIDLVHGNILLLQPFQ